LAVNKTNNNPKNIIIDELWGRRSVFIVENKPLMVAEVFLPQAFAYQTV
jgi:chorismate--pyruvate lyase